MDIIELPTPEMIKAINLRFFNYSLKSDEWKYDKDLYFDIPKCINRVPNRRINKIIKNFPHDESVINQSAYWIRAFVLMHFFPDANHRTALSSLRKILEERGYRLVSTNEQNEEFVCFIKEYRRRKKFNSSMIKEKDEMYNYLIEWLKEKIISL